MISVSRHRLPSAFPANPIFPTKLFQERCVPLSTDPCRIGFLIGFDPVSSVYGNSKDVISRCISQKISDNFEPGNEDSPIQVVWVPGSFEIGTTSQILGKSGKYHVVLCISVVVKGDTSHYYAVVNSATSGILSAGLNSEGREMVRILLAAGANPSAQDAQQQTALHTAAMANDEELVMKPELAIYEQFRNQANQNGVQSNGGFPVPNGLQPQKSLLPPLKTQKMRNLAEALSRDILRGNPGVKWESIKGLDPAKRLVKEAVVMPIKYPKYFTGLLSPWKGILLFGPPGTGKAPNRMKAPIVVYKMLDVKDEEKKLDFVHSWYSNIVFFWYSRSLEITVMK